MAGWRQAAVAAGLALALAGCSDVAAPPPVAEGAEHIACAVGGVAEMREVCAVERVRQDGILVLVVRHPDGAFRRFDVLEDGRGLALSDGGQQAVTAFREGFAELAVGQDRYRFPVTVKADAPRP